MMGSSSSNTSSSSSNMSTACAACKYQRRKCSSDCPLSPYFPADQPKRFANVHKLFGVSNILRLLKHVDPSKREDTVKSIAYEADTREKDPVHGCLGVITVLQNQVAKLKEELHVAREYLFLMEQQQQAIAAPNQLNPFHGTGSPFDDDDDSQFLSVLPKYDPKLSILPLDLGRYGAEDGAMMSHLKAEEQAEQLRRTGSYFGGTDPSYDESPVSHHQMHTMAALDHDPSYHLRSSPTGYGFAPERGLKRANYLLGELSEPCHHPSDLRRAGVYLSLR